MALCSIHKGFVSALLIVAANTCLTYGDTNNLHGIGSSWSCKPAQISVPNSGSEPSVCLWSPCSVALFQCALHGLVQ